MSKSGPFAHDFSSHEQRLLLAAGAYAALTVTVQIAGDVPAAHKLAPVEISTDFIACAGLAFAAIQAVRHWSHLLVRKLWLTNGLGMFMVWFAETIVDGVAGLDFRIIMAVWVTAAVLLFQAMRSYGVSGGVPKVMVLGASAQALAHSVECVQGGAFAATFSGHPALEMIIDTGELIALLSYILAFELARSSGLDDHVMQAAARLREWGAPSHAASPMKASPRARICFPFIGQMHQVFHSLPIAVALAQRHPDIEVHVAANADQLGPIRALVARKAGPVALKFDRLHLAWPFRVLMRFGSSFKTFLLWGNRYYFCGFDALVVPERTSTLLKKKSPAIRLIGTEHGAGDREVTFVPQMALYDFLVLPGDKQAERLLKLGYTRPGDFVSGVYAKLDWTMQESSKPLFPNGRITVLYNPHFEASLSSWPALGWQVLDFFARSREYSLIFAPHVRLFDPPSVAKLEAFDRYRGLGHVLIDLGSERCVDMTYTRAADVYLGDVSSQVVEFITRPRPCVFLNPLRVRWEEDAHYRFWHLGPVVDDIAELGPALTHARKFPRETAQRQRDYLRHTLGDIEPGSGSARGAEAIVAYLKREARRSGPRRIQESQ